MPGSQSGDGGSNPSPPAHFSLCLPREATARLGQTHIPTPATTGVILAAWCSGSTPRSERVGRGSIPWVAIAGSWCKQHVPALTRRGPGASPRRGVTLTRTGTSVAEGRTLNAHVLSSILSRFTPPTSSSVVELRILNPATWVQLPTGGSLQSTDNSAAESPPFKRVVEGSTPSPWFSCTVPDPVTIGPNHDRDHPQRFIELFPDPGGFRMTR